MVKVKFTKSPQLRLWCARSVAVWYDAPGYSTRVALRCVALAWPFGRAGFGKCRGSADKRPSSRSQSSAPSLIPLLLYSQVYTRFSTSAQAWVCSYVASIPCLTSSSAAAMQSLVLACVRRAAYYKILETQPYVPAPRHSYHHRTYRTLSGEQFPESAPPRNTAACDILVGRQICYLLRYGTAIEPFNCMGKNGACALQSSYQSASRLRGDYKSVSNDPQQSRNFSPLHQFSLFTLTLSRHATSFHPLQLPLSHSLL